MRFNFFFSKIILLAVATSLLHACNNAVDKHATAATDSATGPHPTDNIIQNNIADDTTGNYEVMYVTIADTGTGYYPLMREMYSISKTMKIKVDTMNRYYDTRKKEIVLNENDEDELYRGEYCPRRSISNFVSLEYLVNYTSSTTRKTIALVAGVYETQKSADSLLALIKPLAPKAYTMKGRVYVGCMH